MSKKSEAMKRTAKKNLAKAKVKLARVKAKASVELKRHQRALMVSVKRYKLALKKKG